MRLLPQYRGFRVRPYMRFFNQILYAVFFLLLLPIICTFTYLNLASLEQVETVTVSIFAFLVIFTLGMPSWLTWWLQEFTPFFNKFDRLRRMARFLYENGYVYEVKSKSGSNKRKVKFPKVYMKQGKFEMDISFEMAGSKFQDKFKKIGGALEDTLFMDFVETEDEPKYKTYKLAYSALLNRVKGSELVYDLKKGVNLMKNFFWDFHENPHMLVTGGTGGGKTVFLRFLVKALAEIGIVYIGDPKRADFATMEDLKAFKGRVFYEREDIVTAIENFNISMLARYDEMRRQAKEKGHKELGKYYEYGLKPMFLIVDEFNGFINSLDYRERDRAERALINITLLGRQAGVNFIPAMQKPSADDLPTKIRDNLMMRISLGRLSEAGYDMTFGEASKNKEFKYIKRVQGRRVYGRGYAAVNGEVAREFYSPFLENGYSFPDEYEKLDFIPNPQSPTESNIDVNALLNDDELQEALNTLAKGESVVFSSDNEDEPIFDDDFEAVEDYFTSEKLAENLDISVKTLKNLCLKIEAKAYDAFDKQDGSRIFSLKQAVDIGNLLKEKDGSTDTWDVLFEKYYST